MKTISQGQLSVPLGVTIPHGEHTLPLFLCLGIHCVIYIGYYISIGYCTVSRSVLLDIFTHLCILSCSADSTKYVTRKNILPKKLFIIRQINQGNNEFSTVV